MLQLIKEMNGLSLENSKDNPGIETVLNHENIIVVLQEREELPPAYITFLRGLNTNEKQVGKITVKILRLYIYARSKHRGDTKNIKAWLQSGTLPSEKLGARHTMSILYNKLRTYTKITTEKDKLEKEINILTKNTSSSEKNKKGINRNLKSLLSKEFKSSDIDEQSVKLLNEILIILDKFETLIAPRSDQ